MWLSEKGSQCLTEQTLCVSHHDGHFIRAVPTTWNLQLYFIAEEILFGYTNMYLWSWLLRRLIQDHFKLDNSVNWEGVEAKMSRKSCIFSVRCQSVASAFFCCATLQAPGPLVSELLNVSVKSRKLNHLQQVSGRDRKLWGSWQDMGPLTVQGWPSCFEKLALARCGAPGL